MSYEVKDVSLEGRTHGEVYTVIPNGVEGYKVVRYVMRMPARDRYVRRAPIETREEAVEEYMTLMYGTRRA